MWTALGVAVLAFVAEFAADALAVEYQTAVRKLQRRAAVKWGAMLGVLAWVDLGGVAVGWPLWALVGGSLCGGAAGTWYAVGKKQVKARLKAKQKREAHDAATGAGAGVVRGGAPGRLGADPPL